MEENQNLEDDTFRELNVLVSKWFDEQKSVNMKVLYRDHIHNTIELNKCSGTMDLLDLLISHGHLSKYDISILYDTIAITQQLGLQITIKGKLPSIHIPDLKKHVITNFTPLRQRIVKFGLAITEEDVHQICGLYDLQKFEDSWSLIQDLEHRMIICEENIEEFVNKLKKQGLVKAVRALTEGAVLSVTLCKRKHSSSDSETQPSPKKIFDKSHASFPSTFDLTHHAQSNECQPLAIHSIKDLHKNKGTLQCDDMEVAIPMLKEIFCYYQKRGFQLQKTTSGSLVFYLFTYDSSALITLWKIHQSGNILQDLAEILVTEEHLKDFTDRWMTWIDELDYKAALNKLKTKDKLELRDILEKIRSWKPTTSKAPRIAVFGEYSSGKSSFLNSLHWVLQFQTLESPGQFEQIVPSSREGGNVGGGNTNRLRKVKIGPIEFVDTRGFPQGNNDISSEIKRICDGIVWDQKFRIRDYFQVPIRPMDCAILTVDGQRITKHDADFYSRFRKVLKAIKDVSGCIPIVIVTSKSKIPEGEEVYIHASLTGMGAAWAFFIENYLVDSKGNFPTRKDLNIKQHLEFCKVLQVIEREYDAYQNAVSEIRRRRPLSFFLVPVLVVLFAIILKFLVLAYYCQ